MQPTVGRIVHYTLSASNVEQINRRRTDGVSIRQRIEADKWPLGAQAHIGNTPREGDVLPMLICKVWNSDGAPSVVNGQVFLDGNDQFWVTSAKEGAEPGTWTWPPRA